MLEGDIKITSFDYYLWYIIIFNQKMNNVLVHKNCPPKPPCIKINDSEICWKIYWKKN